MDCKLSIAVFSDTHGNYHGLQVPKADVLICCGDFADTSKLAKGMKFIEWYAQQPADVKILIPGNHDNVCEKYVVDIKNACQQHKIHYLDNTGVVYKNVHFWGFPYACYNLPGAAFDLENDESIRPKLVRIPDTIDVFISHVPPFGIMDKGESGEHHGSRVLLEKVLYYKPRYHLFGHVHGQSGQIERDGVQFVNTAVTNNQLELVNTVKLLTVQAKCS